MSDLRKHLGDDFDALFDVHNNDISINADRVEIAGSTRDGAFLEGVEVDEPKFRTWLAEKRSHDTENRLKLPTYFSSRINPSIAVIPFVPFMDDAFERRIGDVLALEVSRVLSRSHMLDVTSHFSSRRFQFAKLDICEVRQALNVDFLLYGNVRHENGKLAVYGDLLDVRTEQIIWSRQYSASSVELMAQNDNVVHELALDVSRSMTRAALKLHNTKPKEQLDNHTLLMTAVSLMHGHRRANFNQARDVLEELISRAPNESKLHAWLGKWYVLKSNSGLSTELEADKKRANQCTEIALHIDPTCPFSLTMDGLVKSNLLQNFDLAVAQWNKALDYEPSNAMAWLLKGAMHAFADEGMTAVACTGKSRNLSPLDPHKYYFDCLSATSDECQGQGERAEEPEPDEAKGGDL
ncbi:MAG: hypothetical protein AAF141_00715, partial [Pseudomonadota bacterium]